MYSDDEVSLIKTEYLRLRNADYDGSIYQEISRILGAKGYERSAEAIRKKISRLGLPDRLGDKRVRRAIALPDIHVPYQDKKALELVETYMDDHDWDIYINLGDHMDLDQISSYNDRKPRILEGKRLEDDYRKAKEVLSRHRDILGEDCEMYYLEGNHEERLNRYLDANPQHEGMMEIPVRLDLDELNIHWLKSWSQGENIQIGEASFSHGYRTNKYHSRKMVAEYMTNIFYGHTHDVQSFPLESKSSNSVYVGQSLGCLCEYDQQYKKGKPDNWQQAFGVFYFFPNGNFNHYVPRIFDYKFISPEGEVYEL